jgi:NADH-quinone oxidoreductase subunit D
MTQLSDRRLHRRYDPLLTEKVLYNVGPQHPSLPAPLQLHVQADGELIERIVPEVGFMHRGVEYLCAKRTYSQCADLLSRCEWLAGSNGDYLVSAAVEELAGIEVPERAQWLRMIVLELSRIASHLFWFGQLGLEAGNITAIFWALREREGALALLEMLSGHRWHHGWIIPGGVRSEPPERFYSGLRDYLDLLARRIEEYEEFFSDNAIWINRSELIGTLPAEYALAHGASGPVLRGSGIAHDLRRDQPYLKYADVEFNVPAGEFGDVLDRYRVRFFEMRESMRILEQCIDTIENMQATVGATPASPAPESIEGDQISSGAAVPGRQVQGSRETRAGTPAPLPELRNPAPTDIPRGEVYVAVEGPRGELGLSVVSDGGPRPARMHLRSPSLYHLHLLNELCRGFLLADLFVILGSLDIMVGEVDR